MSNQILKIALRSVRLSQRALSTTAARSHGVTLDQAAKERIYPKIGNRDVVGYGFNGSGSYADRQEFPCPGIRFRENTSDVLALREKEKGDWKTLTMEEKKALYRASFCQTFAEMNAPTGEWKSIVATMFLCLSVTGWIIIWLKNFVYQPLPHTFTREWQHAQADKMIAQRQGRITGISSEWDYEKNQWK